MASSSTRDPQRNTSDASTSSFLGLKLKNLKLRPADIDNDTKGRLGLILLNNPPNPAIDFVFVHGLGGGSRKTWSKSDNPEHFWPRAWLPHDQEFRNVRIHSFGYDADWGSMKADVSNIGDFALGLLNVLKYAESMRGSDDVRIYLTNPLPEVPTNDSCRFH